MMNRVVVLFLAIIVLASCGGGSDSPSNVSDSFDRGALLLNYTDNNIIPSFTDFDSKLLKLKTDTEVFVKTPNVNTLLSLRESWLKAYKSWQHVAKYNVGKAETVQFLNHFNIYPVAIEDVEANIKNGNYDFKHPNNHDAQGFPALDYLLYGLGDTDNQILNKFNVDDNANGYKKYIVDVVAFMYSVNKDILNNWKSDYKSEFISSTANTSTSSFNMLINSLVFYYEKRLRAVKIGIPAGNFSATPLPEKVEGLYSKKYSKDLLLEAFNSFSNLFHGVSFDGNTKGVALKTYLKELDRKDLVDRITNQLNVSKKAIESLDSSLYNQVKQDNTKMTEAYDELQKLVILLKVDMLQAFNVGVDYVDADGD